MIKSFSANTKLEMARVKCIKSNSQLAELSAFAFSCGTISLGRGRLCLSLETEYEAVAKRISGIVKNLCGLMPPMSQRQQTQPNKQVFFVIDIASDAPEGRLLFDIGFLEGKPEDYRFSMPRTDILDGNFDDVLRGAFMGCGVLCDPRKSYRLEFVLSNEDFSDYLFNLLVENGISVRKNVRGGRIVLYLKSIEHILKVLVCAGAHSTALEIENIRVEKEVRNQINRHGNCDYANMDKTIEAAQKQISDINFIFEKCHEEILTPAIREACELRLNNPEASLSELARISASASRSALNKRFIKISQLAAEYGKDD